MQKHFAAISFLLCRNRCIQSYCGNFNMAILYNLLASELNNAKITVRNFSSVLSSWVLHEFFIHSGLEHCNFLNSDISQSSPVTQLRCGGIVNEDFVAYLPMNLSVKEFWKSVNIWRSYGQDYSGLFFIDSQCTSKYRTQKIVKNRHLGTIAKFCRAVSSQPRHRPISTSEKSLLGLNSNICSTCPDNTANFGRLAAEIDSGVWGTPSKFQRVSRFGFVIAATSLAGGHPNFARCLAVSWAGTYIHFRRLLPPDGILPGAKFTLRPSLAFSDIGSVTARHSVLLNWMIANSVNFSSLSSVICQKMLIFHWGWNLAWRRGPKFYQRMFNGRVPLSY